MTTHEIEILRQATYRANDEATRAICERALAGDDSVMPAVETAWARRVAMQTREHDARAARLARLSVASHACRDCGAPGVLDARGLGISCGCAAE